ncbi:uncharacterized protein EAF01_002446 [Botrytis porri]|uniref:uncharacterized protein n=1 Tax=Botrytis porri TaxID=87229 RepID=UPI001902749C|nr:uncharacterized protein EAF01_002446 [Botrytis porri]KAF7910937.1 hypothetical protein EAF01_002446 [Botrytis porri]
MDYGEGKRLGFVAYLTSSMQEELFDEGEGVIDRDGVIMSLDLFSTGYSLSSYDMMRAEG